MYDETGSERDEVLKGHVLPPEGRSVADEANHDPVERQLKLAVQSAAKGLVVTATLYLGYRLWKARTEQS